MKRLACLSLVAASAAHADAPAPAAGAQKLTFERAIAIALEGSADIELAKEVVAGADAKAAGAKANRWVSLHLNANLNRWREPYALDFGGASFTLHEAVTSTMVVSLSQPLTGLAYLQELVGAAEHDADATRRDYDRVRLETAYKTADAYIRVLEARATAEVAHQSVADIQSELDRANQLRQADTYTDIDVLRFKSAKAAADQIALRADTSVQTALAGLVVTMGLGDGAAVDLADDLPVQPPTLKMALAQVLQRAIDTRPELRAAHSKIESAEAARTAAHYKYYPDIRAVAAWQRFTGVQPFQPENEEYIGLTAQWNVWDWGATHQGVLDAEHAKERATITANQLAEQVKLDVRRRWLEAKTQFDSLAVAQTQLETAEEAYRLQKVKLDNAAATTTDVLDAETEVARARLGFATARYDYYLDLVALARAVGDLPTPKQ
jgi:outer membrane protein TolC